MTPKQVIKHYGNGDLREAAYRLGYSENALRYWVKKNRVPRHAQKRIAAESGGKLKAMRPNVEFSGTPAALSPEAPLERRVGHGGSDGE